jgi:hypothetical protein
LALVLLIPPQTSENEVGLDSILQITARPAATYRESSMPATSSDNGISYTGLEHQSGSDFTQIELFKNSLLNTSIVFPVLPKLGSV